MSLSLFRCIFHTRFKVIINIALDAMEKKFEDLKVSVPTLASKQPAGKRGIEFEGRVNAVPLS